MTHRKLFRKELFSERVEEEPENGENCRKEYSKDVRQSQHGGVVTFCPLIVFHQFPIATEGRILECLIDQLLQSLSILLRFAL